MVVSSNLSEPLVNSEKKHDAVFLDNAKSWRHGGLMANIAKSDQYITRI